MVISCVYLAFVSVLRPLIRSGWIDVNDVELLACVIAPKPNGAWSPNRPATSASAERSTTPAAPAAGDRLGRRDRLGGLLDECHLVAP